MLTPSDRVRLCEEALNNPILQGILDEMEQQEIDRAIDAAPLDDATRAEACRAVRTVKTFRLKLKAKLEENRQNAKPPRA